jgi:hypothetical protein
MSQPLTPLFTVSKALANSADSSGLGWFRPQLPQKEKFPRMRRSRRKLMIWEEKV